MAKIIQVGNDKPRITLPVGDGMFCTSFRDVVFEGDVANAYRAGYRDGLLAPITYRIPEETGIERHFREQGESR